MAGLVPAGVESIAGRDEISSKCCGAASEVVLSMVGRRGKGMGAVLLTLGIGCGAE